MRTDKRRGRWMANFEAQVIEAMPEARGKIKWDDAAYFFNIHLVSDEAAARYVKTHGG
jgi:hypothetical protein